MNRVTLAKLGEAMGEKVGDDKAGFSVDLMDGVILVRGWGFWDKELAESFDVTLVGFCRRNPHHGVIKAGFDHLKPLREEGQTSFVKLMQALPDLKITRVDISVGSHLTKLQLMRLVAESGQQGLVVFIGF
jgi:hypothetical protein